MIVKNTEDLQKTGLESENTYCPDEQYTSALKVDFPEASSYHINKTITSTLKEDEIFKNSLLTHVPFDKEQDSRYIFKKFEVSNIQNTIYSTAPNQNTYIANLKELKRNQKFNKMSLYSNASTQENYQSDTMLNALKSWRNVDKYNSYLHFPNKLGKILRSTAQPSKINVFQGNNNVNGSEKIHHDSKISNLELNTREIQYTGRYFSSKINPVINNNSKILINIPVDESQNESFNLFRTNLLKEFPNTFSLKRENRKVILEFETSNIDDSLECVLKILKNTYEITNSFEYLISEKRSGCKESNNIKRPVPQYQAKNANYAKVNFNSDAPKQKVSGKTLETASVNQNDTKDENVGPFYSQKYIYFTFFNYLLMNILNFNEFNKILNRNLCSSKILSKAPFEIIITGTDVFSVTACLKEVKNLYYKYVVMNFTSNTEEKYLNSCYDLLNNKVVMESDSNISSSYSIGTGEIKEKTDLNNSVGPFSNKIRCDSQKCRPCCEFADNLLIPQNNGKNPETNTQCFQGQKVLDTFALEKNCLLRANQAFILIFKPNNAHSLYSNHIGLNHVYSKDQTASISVITDYDLGDFICGKKFGKIYKINNPFLTVTIKEKKNKKRLDFYEMNQNIYKKEAIDIEESVCNQKPFSFSVDNEGLSQDEANLLPGSKSQISVESYLLKEKIVSNFHPYKEVFKSFPDKELGEATGTLTPRDLSFEFNIKGTAFEVSKCYTELYNEFPAENTFTIDKKYHKKIIGSGGFTIQKIMKRYNVYVKFLNETESETLGLRGNSILKTPIKNRHQMVHAKNEILKLCGKNIQDKESSESINEIVPECSFEGIEGLFKLKRMQK